MIYVIVAALSGLAGATAVALLSAAHEYRCFACELRNLEAAQELLTQLSKPVKP